MSVMAMGARWSAETMDLISKTLAGHCDYAIEAPPVPVAIQTHVDNIRGITRSREEAQRYAEWLQSRTDDVGATLNEDGLGVHQVGPFCGLEFDYKSKKVRLLPKTARKIPALVSKVEENNLTAADVAEMFGVIFYASTALRIDVAPFYFAMKAYRRIASRLSKGSIDDESRLKLTSCVHKQLLQWLAKLKDNRWTAPPRVMERHFIMYSDASLTGWGAVLIRVSDQQVFSVGDRWNARYSGHHNINTLEAIAVLEGLHAFKELLEGSSVELRVDNTSCAFAVRKGYASSLFECRHSSHQ